MVNTEALMSSLDNLENVTVKLDEDFHQLLNFEEEIETDLREELQEDEELMDLTNKGLQVVDQLEKIEEKIEKHEKAAEKDGVTHEDMKDILGHSYVSIGEDIKELRKVIMNVKHQLEDFEENQRKTSREINKFDDILDHMAQGEQKLEEMDERLDQLHDSNNY